VGPRFRVEVLLKICNTQNNGIHQNTAILAIHQNTCNTPGYCLKLVGKVHCTATPLVLYNVAAHTLRKPTPITAHIYICCPYK
jgi:hypothetical protein